jgi:hypothetical protein
MSDAESDYEYMVHELGIPVQHLYEKLAWAEQNVEDARTSLAVAEEHLAHMQAVVAEADAREQEG